MGRGDRTMESRALGTMNEELATVGKEKLSGKR